VASVALGKENGVAKRATLVSVKTGRWLQEIAEGLNIAHDHIAAHEGRSSKAVVVCTSTQMEASSQSDPSLEEHLAKTAIQRLLDLGIPVVQSAGNEHEKGRPNIDTWPQYFASEEFPLIVVGATTQDSVRWSDSQVGEQLTTYAPGDGVQTLLAQDRWTALGSGTSLSAPAVAGVIATYLASDTRPWNDGLTGIERVKAIRDFIKNDDRGGWQRPGGERIIYNGVKAEDQISAQPDPDLPPAELECYINTKPPKVGGKKTDYLDLLDSFCNNILQQDLSHTNDFIDTYFGTGDISMPSENEVKFSVYWTVGSIFTPNTESCLTNLRNILWYCDYGSDHTSGGQMFVNAVGYRVEPMYEKPKVEDPGEKDEPNQCTGTGDVFCVGG
jgi:hypothetical protein